jgi:phosphomannomutase
MLHREFGEHHYGRLDLALEDGQKEKALARFLDERFKRLLDWPIVRRENLDGVKLYLGEIGWVLVRAAGTEQKLRIYSETTRPETTRRVLDAVARLVGRLSPGRHRNRAFQTTTRYG